MAWTKEILNRFLTKKRTKGKKLKKNTIYLEVVIGTMLLVWNRVGNVLPWNKFKCLCYVNFTVFTADLLTVLFFYVAM